MRSDFIHFNHKGSKFEISQFAGGVLGGAFGRRGILFFAFAFLLQGCQSVFYQPDDFEWFKIDPERLKVQDLKIPTEGMAQLDAKILYSVQDQEMSDKKHGQAKGLVVQFHGNAQNLSSHMTGMFWLLYQGYDVLVFDYQGYGKSTGKDSRKGTVADGLAVMKYASQLVEYQKLPIFYIGQSLGGAVLFVSLAKASPEVKARVGGIVIDSSFASYRSMARSKLNQFWLSWLFQWPLAFVVSDDLSPTQFQVESGIPFLFVHDPADKVVPFSQGEMFFQHVQVRHKSLIKSDQTGHIGALTARGGSYRDQVLSFFSENSLHSRR